MYDIFFIKQKRKVLFFKNISVHLQMTNFGQGNYECH